MNEPSGERAQAPEYQAFIPNGVLNFFISLIPGAGQMYQGMLQRGVIMMACFAGFITLTIFFGRFMYEMGGLFSGAAITGLVITYFYSFFDSVRTCRLLRSGVQLQDYMGTLDRPSPQFRLKMQSGGRVALGVLLTAAGALGLGFIAVERYLPYQIFEQYVRPVAEMVIPGAILLLGIILLIRARKRPKNAG